MQGSIQRSVCGEQPTIAALLQEFREGVPVKMADAAALEHEGGLENLQLKGQQLVRGSAHGATMRRYLPIVKTGGRSVGDDLSRGAECRPAAPAASAKGWAAGPARDL